MLCPFFISVGQNERVATIAPVGRFVHWMGYVFSFGIKCGSSQSISFSIVHCIFFLGVYSWLFFPWT
jgi:hypothetical protein